MPSDSKVGSQKARSVGLSRPSDAEKTGWWKKTTVQSIGFSSNATRRSQIAWSGAPSCWLALSEMKRTPW